MLNVIFYEKWRKVKNLFVCFEEIRNGFVKVNNKFLYFFNFEEKERCEWKNICCLNVIVCWYKWCRYYWECRMFVILKNVYVIK